MKSILEAYAPDGNINLEKLDQSFNEAEKRAIKTIQDINSSLTETSIFTAAIIRGDKITPVNNYVHHNVLYDFKSDNNEGMSLVDAYNTSMRPSTKAKSLIERTGKITPLNFDAFASAERRQVCLDGLPPNVSHPHCALYIYSSAKEPRRGWHHKATARNSKCY